MSFNCVEDEYSLTTGLYHRGMGITMPKEEIAVVSVFVCASVTGQFDVDEFEAIITESLQALTVKKDVGWYWEGGREV
jgi:hypothetical protein